MAELQFDDIFNKILESVKAALGDKWEEAADFAEVESKKFAINIIEIGKWKATGKISEEQAEVLLRMHQRSMEMVLTALEGISLILAERAMNAAIKAIKDIVNTATGWELL